MLCPPAVSFYEAPEDVIGQRESSCSQDTVHNERDFAVVGNPIEKEGVRSLYDIYRPGREDRQVKRCPLGWR